jgi:hypothetical protein
MKKVTIAREQWNHLAHLFPLQMQSYHPVRKGEFFSG